MSDIESKYLLFEVDEEYALPLTHVIEIIEAREITKVPETPDYIAGILNLRGHVIPVLDVRKRFRKPARPDAPRRCVIIASVEQNPLGLLVDNVIDLIEIQPEQLKDPPQVGSSYINVFIGHIGIGENKMHLIVSADRLVNYNDLYFLEGAEAEKGEP